MSYAGYHAPVFRRNVGQFSFLVARHGVSLEAHFVLYARPAQVHAAQGAKGPFGRGSGRANYGGRAGDQPPPQIAIALFADAGLPFAPAAAVCFRRQPKPGGKLAPARNSEASGTAAAMAEAVMGPMARIGRQPPAVNVS